MSIPKAIFYGGAIDATFGGPEYTLSIGHRVQRLTPTAQQVKCWLPRANEPPLLPGGPVLCLFNLSAFHIDLYDRRDLFIYRMGPGECVICCMMNNNNSGGDWRILQTCPTTTVGPGTTTALPPTTPPSPPTTPPPGTTTSTCYTDGLGFCITLM